MPIVTFYYTFLTLLRLQKDLMFLTKLYRQTVRGVSYSCSIVIFRENLLILKHVAKDTFGKIDFDLNF